MPPLLVLPRPQRPANLLLRVGEDAGLDGLVFCRSHIANDVSSSLRPASLVQIALMTIKGKRQDITDSTKRKLIQFYGNWLCIVEGTEDPEYHHLNENPAHSIWENLAPINGTLNSKIETDVWSVDTASILAKAEKLERRSKYTRAYGCQRLLGWIHRKLEVPDLELSAIAACIRTLRPILDYHLIEHTLRFSLEPLISDPVQRQRIGCTKWAQLCEEISNVVRDGSHYVEFEIWNAHKNDFLELTDHSPEAIFRKIQTLRHQAFSVSEQGDWTKASALTDKAIALGKDMGVESMITQRKTHILFEMRKHRELNHLNDFEQTLEYASKHKLICKSPTELATLLDPRIDPNQVDSWAECHMQNLRVAFLDACGQKKKAASLFGAYAEQYKQPHGIKATKKGNIPALAPYLAQHNITSIWQPLPKSLLLLISTLESKMPAIVQQQKNIAVKWKAIIKS